MKKIWISLLFISLYSNAAHSMETKDIDIFGYARAGVGTNTYGGQQECFYNQGAGGWGGVGRNEFRLGNECSNYLEIALTFNHIKTETKKVITQFRVANSHDGRDATESKSQSTNFVEAFAEMQGMIEQPWNFWVGKKFYRDQDVYMDDYYYFGSMNGNGAGVGNIDFLKAKLAFAYLREVKDTRTDALASGIKTNVGLPGITVYDVRLKHLAITNSIKQNFWVAFGQSPESTNSTTGTKYLKANGFILGTLLEFDLNGKGFNHMAAMYGQGLMNSFSLYGDSFTTLGSQQSSDKRLRFINHTTFDINEKWAFHSSLNFERLTENGNSKEQWWGAGVRPIYRVTQHFHLVTEAGTSFVQSNGTRRLTRLTFAPQLSISENIWGHPVLRAFYTHSFWTANNRANIAQNAPTYIDKKSGGAYGFQMESFF